MMFVSFLLGAMLGGTLGVLVMALLQASRW